MYEAQLKELGLTENEIRIYLLLLKQGMMNPSKIAQKLNLHRGYVYDTLERMREKEFVNSVLIKNKKHFQATNPENVRELLKFKLEQYEQILPKLQGLTQNQEEKTRVEIHKGKRVYRTLLKDITANLKEGDRVFLTGVNEEILIKEVEPIYLQQYFSTIKEKNINEQVIMKKGNKKFSIKNVSHKFLAEEYVGNTEQIIYGDKVALFLLGDPYYLIIIENKEIAETYKKQFSLLWKIAK